MPIDIYFYIYLLIAILLLILTGIILIKGRNRVNLLFIITPTFFTLILVFNILEYFGEVPDFLLWIPYLLAPLGILFAGWYILYGIEFTYERKIIAFSTIYILFSFVLSLTLQLQVDDDPNIIGISHLMLVVPLIWAGFEYNKISHVIPDQRRKIIFMVVGLVIVCLGTIIRSVNLFLNNQLQDFDLYETLGLVVIIIGTFLILGSFILQPTVKNSQN